MRILILFVLLAVSSATIQAQVSNEQHLPKWMTAEEEILMKDYISNMKMSADCEPLPDNTTLRSMGEWEELQSIVITWAAYSGALTEIVRHAKEECEVIIVTTNIPNVKNTLTNAGVDWSENVTFLNEDFNTVWVRDYGPNTVYLDDVGELAIVDWIYNRPRPKDDQIPNAIAELMDLPIYCTTEFPNDLVHTGGNFMADGIETGFSSRLVLEENDATNDWGVSNHSEEDVEALMSEYMGINKYVKMVTLPFDGIHHIDMHMKLLDEETIMVGEYPEGVADGPQIEANIQYILDQFVSPYGTPYRIVRVPMPADGDGNYPDKWWADYRTYANALFVNKTILVPSYEEKYDTTAFRIWEEAMPGYKIIGVDCNQVIQAGGAIHCITKEMGVSNPLYIEHQRLRDVTEAIPDGYIVDATIKHVAGIENATMYYSLDKQTYTPVTMELSDATTHVWSATIPEQPAGTTVYYYVHAISEDGKEQSRPMPAPEGYWAFDINYGVVGLEESEVFTLNNIFPNPASAITCIPVTLERSMNAEILLVDVFGKQVQEVYSGTISAGDSKYFINANEYSAGTYFVQIKTENGIINQKLIIQ